MTDDPSRDDPLLFGSKSLTMEEEALRTELLEWCRAKLAKGHRPIPLHAALSIAANEMKEPPANWLRKR
jgi:hypothetical protein